MKQPAGILLVTALLGVPMRAQSITTADVIIAVDSSGSMMNEVLMVQSALNQFASAISSSGVDLHIVLICEEDWLGGICAPAPLGSGSCPGDSNLPSYRHNTTAVSSNDALQKIVATYNSWSASLRAAASTTVIVVSDDESNWSSSTFDTQFKALNPNFQNYRFDALVSTSPCAGTVTGQQYINLATQTGGLVRNLCNQNFGPDFDAMAVAVAGPMSIFCTAGTTTHGCVPSISGAGTPSASATNGFTISVNNVEGAKAGLIFYGIDNTAWTPLQWSIGSTSYLCIAPPTQRTPAQVSAGTADQCNGVLSIDWTAFVAANPGSLGAPFASGRRVYAQGWFRDPPAPKTTNLSNALRFTLAP